MNLKPHLRDKKLVEATLSNSGTYDFLTFSWNGALEKSRLKDCLEIKEGNRVIYDTIIKKMKMQDGEAIYRFGGNSTLRGRIKIEMEYLYPEVVVEEGQNLAFIKLRNYE